MYSHNPNAFWRRGNPCTHNRSTRMHALINIERGERDLQQKRLFGLCGKTTRISNGGWIKADRT